MDGAVADGLRLILSIVAALVLSGCGARAGVDVLPNSTAVVAVAEPIIPPEGQSSAAAPEEETAAEIYALVVRRLAGPDDTFGGQLPKRTLYLVRETNDAAGDPTTGPATSGPLPAETQAGIAARLADLPAAVIWVDSFDDVALDPSTWLILDDGVIIQLGTIRFEGEARALVPGSIYVASMGAGGATYVVELQGDQWLLTGTSGPT
ncbi:MAG TPA: hypothetical protein PKD53_26955 [Chloroflexaceae bacterium]|nr:hypothetical protein [Chloroflexaceae bacterium]